MTLSFIPKLIAEMKEIIVVASHGYATSMYIYNLEFEEIDPHTHSI